MKVWQKFEVCVLMKTILLSLLSAFLLASCAGTKETENTVNIGIAYAWQKHHECSTTSPQIELSGVPDGTAQLKVKMRDLDSPNYSHGGGTIAFTGNTTIEQGALKKYKGPCPPNVHRYVISVTAYDENGVILGKGKQMQIYPPE